MPEQKTYCQYQHLVYTRPVRRRHIRLIQSESANCYTIAMMVYLCKRVGWRWGRMIPSNRPNVVLCTYFKEFPPIRGVIHLFFGKRRQLVHGNKRNVRRGRGTLSKYQQQWTDFTVINMFSDTRSVKICRTCLILIRLVDSSGICIFIIFLPLFSITTDIQQFY